MASAPALPAAGAPAGDPPLWGRMKQGYSRFYQRWGSENALRMAGGASSKSRVSFAGGLATAGVSALVSGDKIAVYYRAF